MNCPFQDGSHLYLVELRCRRTMKTHLVGGRPNLSWLSLLGGMRDRLSLASHSTVAHLKSMHSCGLLIPSLLFWWWGLWWATAWSGLRAKGCPELTLFMVPLNTGWPRSGFSTTKTWNVRLQKHPQAATWRLVLHGSFLLILKLMMPHLRRVMGLVPLAGWERHPSGRKCRSHSFKIGIETFMHFHACSHMEFEWHTIVYFICCWPFFPLGCLRKGANMENQGLAMNAKGQGKGKGNKNVFPILQVGADPYSAFLRLPTQLRNA